MNPFTNPDTESAPAMRPQLPTRAGSILNGHAVLIVMIIALSIVAITLYSAKRTFDTGERVLNWPGKVADKLGKLFQTNVTVNNASFTLGQKDIAELAVVQRRIVCTTRYDASWYGSDATVFVQGTFTIKAGYDLKQGCRMGFDERGKVVSIQLPEPKVLSITTDSQNVIFASEGILKKITPKEMETVFAQNLEQARREANDLGLLEDAKSRIKERLNDLLGSDADRIELSSPGL